MRDPARRKRWNAEARHKPKGRKGLLDNPERLTELERPGVIDGIDGARKEEKAKPGPIKFDPDRVKDLFGDEGWLGPVFEVEKIPQRDNPFRPKFDFLEPMIPQFPGRGTSFYELSKDFEDIPIDVPLMLLPVRLETRFIEDKEDGRQLHIRVMPGDIFMSPANEQITEDDLKAAKAFVALADEKGFDAPEVIGAWTANISRPDGLQFARAYQVVRENLDAETVKLDEIDASLVSEFLPDRWLAVGYLDQAIAFTAFSQPIEAGLRFTPDPANLDAVKDTASDPATAWMFSFERAWQDGMGIKADLSGDAWDRIDEIFVLGWQDNRNLKTKSDGSLETAKKVNRILGEQHYAFGAGFVPQGVATNNTRQGRSGWSAVGGDAEAAWMREREEPLAAMTAQSHVSEDKKPLWPGPGLMSTSTAKSNAGRMKKALGLEDISSLRRFQFREGAEGAAMAAMNTALWPTTFGELLGTLLDQPGKDDFFDSDLMTWVRDWYLDHVSGGGVLPALRIGERPYGVMPVQRHTMRQFGMSLVDAGKYPQKQLAIFLETLMTHWVAATGDVITLGPEGRSDGGFHDPGEQLLAILQQAPNPQRVLTSYLESSESTVKVLFEENRRLLSDPDSSELLAAALTLDFGEELTINLAEVYSDFFRWPNRFLSYRAMENHLAGVQSVWASVLSPVRDYPFNDDAWAEFFADTMQQQNEAAINDIIALYDVLLEAIAEHRSRNFVMDLLGAPLHLVNSVPGGDVDPAFSYLVHGVEEKPWPKEHFVRVDKGTETVEPDVWLEHLHEYANALVEGEPAPDAPQFPDGQAPLLYKLMRTGLRRMATARTTETAIFGGFLEEMSFAQGRISFAAAEAVSAQQFQAVTGSMNYVFQTAQKSVAAPAATAEFSEASIEGMTQMLVATPVEELQQVSGALHLLLEEDDQPDDFPYSAVREMVDTLDFAVAEFSGVIKELKPPTLSQKRKKELREMRDAIGVLKRMTPEQLELLMSQTFGVVGWRLDAWITSIANWRLETLREKRPTGLQLGAYGYVHTLQRAPDGVRGRSQGFIAAPSIAHAKTAAVLRSGWTAYGAQNADSPFAVDLSSKRVRKARKVLDAVRQGRDMSAILGQGIETELRKTEEGSVWILPLRRATPKQAEDGGASVNPAEVARKSVDGLDLHLAISTTLGRQGLIADAKAELEALLPSGLQIEADWVTKLEEALDGLNDSVDALADVGIAESVHQLIQGNVERAGATLRAIQTGEASPPELDVLNTVTAARSMQHQLVLPLDASATGGATSLASAAAPEVSVLLSDLMGAEALTLDWRILSETGETLKTGGVQWEDELAKTFGLTALDLMRATATSGFAGLKTWVGAYLGETMREALPHTATVEVQFAKMGEVEDGATLEALLDSWRTVLGQARSFDPRDVPPATNASGTAEVDVGSVEGRANGLRDAVGKAKGELKLALGEAYEDPAGLPEDIDPLAEEAEQALITLAQAGLPDALLAYRYSRTGGRRLGAALAGAIPRINQIAARLEAYAIDHDTTAEARLKAAKDILQATLGKGLPVVAPIRWDGLTGYRDSFGESEDRLKDSFGAIEMWIERQGYTNEALGDASLAVDLTETMGLGTARYAVSQWPEAQVEPWIAVQPAKERDGPKRSAVVLNLTGAEETVPLSASGDFIGLVLADVIETVPSTEVDMAAALHFDSPNAEAPQAILLAVPHEDDTKWTFDTVLHTVRTAFDLSKIRLTDGTSISQFNQILPAIYAGAGLHGDNDFDV